ncbi:MAG: ferrous iron transport protein B [Pirellulaceae bacterium]|nr:ferrous iron transport protein B [Pirellulaceae bacterium]
MWTSALSAQEHGRLTIALMGNPNTGKSTFFSGLCGVPARIGNYPGVTVEKKLGSYRDSEGLVTVVDLPGTYSLTARTPDEKVSVDVLLGRVAEVPNIDVIVHVADATNLERNLYLFTQLRQLGVPLLLVLNMWDRAQTGVQLDVRQLSQRLGVPIVQTSANRGQGLDEVRRTLRELSRTPPSAAPDLFPVEFQHECRQLQQWLEARGHWLPDFAVQRLILDTEGAHAEQLGRLPELSELNQQLMAVRGRLLSTGQRVPAVEIKSRYKWIRAQLADIYQPALRAEHSTSDRIDRWLTHRWSGFAFFGCLMFIIFQFITRGASWLSSWIDDWLVSSCASLMESSMSPGILRSLLTDGVVAGVGSVLVFLPIILLLFFFIGLLEDCGYMARAAFVMDKLMTRLGLTGKSFLPLMSSFACAVPGIMATRVIESWRDRMVTILIAPLMSCSARLPVYALMITAFVPDKTWLGGWIGLQGLVLMAMSMTGLMVAIPVAWLLKRFWFRGQPSAFVMELPSYKLPSLWVVVQRVWEQALAFMTRAGTLIFCTAILVWAAGYFPGDHRQLDQLNARIESANSDTDSNQLELWQSQRRQLAADLIEHSWLGRFGKTIEPLVKPLGWDWKIGVGVIASFPAREVIIATLGTIYSLGGDVNEEDSGLHAALHASRWPDGRPVFNLAVALSVMVFFALCAQCAATLMVIRRETNSWFWPVFTFAYMTTLAYLGALITYQLSSRWLS